MKKALVYLILCCTALPAGAQTLTLDECRAAAAEHNRTLRDGRFELEAALQTRREALTGYFPQVSATGGVFQAQHGLVQADFGMTISSRCKLIIPKKPKEPENKFDLFGEDERGDESAG